MRWGPVPPTAPTGSRWRGGAGLPRKAISRARAILKRLESEDAPSAALDSLPLFAVAEPEPEPLAEPSEVERRLAQIDPDTLSPRDALDLVYALKALVKKA